MKRRLSKDDKLVWDHVRKSVEPFKPAAEKPVEAVVKRQTKKLLIERPGIVNAALPKKPEPPKRSQAPAFGENRAKTSPNLDKRTFQKFLKGQMEIDQTIDLHGMTSTQAKSFVLMRIRQAHSAGQRLLLVITGKGTKTRLDEFNRTQSGILRREFPEWIKGPDLSHMVLQVSNAQQKHGGAGAFYVYLRRKRA